MPITFHPYEHPKDYARVSAFLISHYQADNQDGNWLEPTWEYMYFHPYLDSSALDKIGIWQAGEEIVGVVNFESTLGEAFFQFHPDHHDLADQMLDYAEANLWGYSEKDRHHHLAVFVTDVHPKFMACVQARGYERQDPSSRPLTRLKIPSPFPEISLPNGFRLTSLAEERNWEKVHRVLWRGFNHPGEPPAGEKELEERRVMFETPKAHLDLKIAVAAPDGSFVSFCGMFYEDVNHYAYVEPVATDPDYRRMGLGKAAVLEGIRRCGELGATVAYVGSDQAFYGALGFEAVNTDVCWVKTR